MDVNECLLVSVDFTRGRDVGIMVVGRKGSKTDVEVINAFQGEEAYQLYQKLITKQEVQ